MSVQKTRARLLECQAGCARTSHQPPHRFSRASPTAIAFAPSQAATVVPDGATQLRRRGGPPAVLRGWHTVTPSLVACMKEPAAVTPTQRDGTSKSRELSVLKSSISSYHDERCQASVSAIADNGCVPGRVWFHHPQMSRPTVEFRGSSAPAVSGSPAAARTRVPVANETTR